jgi:hypothetical protein
MSGHRRATRKPVRREVRSARFQQMLASAPTIEAQASVAFDWWRSAARHLPERDQLFIEMATRLANEAHQLDRRPR